MIKSLTLSINSAVSWVLKIFMFVVASYFFLTGNVLLGGFAFLVLLVSLIPAVVNRSFDTNLPWSLDFLLTLWLALSVLGEIRFYEQLPWWDDFLHFAGTAVLVYLAFVLVFALNFTGKIRLSIPLIGFFTFLIGVAFGAIWEIAEFFMWKTTGADALAMGNPPNFEMGLFDTFSDLKLDAISSALIALAGMKYVGRRRHVKLREWMQPFTKIFGSKIKRARLQTAAKLREGKAKLEKKLKLVSKSPPSSRRK